MILIVFKDLVSQLVVCTWERCSVVPRAGDRVKASGCTYEVVDTAQTWYSGEVVHIYVRDRT